MRLNPYNLPHKALRMALGKLNDTMGRTDVTDEADLKELQDLCAEVVEMLEGHTDLEERIFLAPLEEKSPGATSHDLDVHEVLDPQVAVWGKKINDLNAGDSEVLGKAREAYMEFNKFHGDYLNHIWEEEQHTLTKFWENFTDEELMGIMAKTQAEIPPEKMMVWLKYAIPAQNHQELAAIFASMKENAPAPVFMILMGMAENLLSESDFQKLKATGL